MKSHSWEMCVEISIEIIIYLFQTWPNFCWKEVPESFKKEPAGRNHILFLYWKAQDNTTLFYTQENTKHMKLKKHEKYSTVTLEIICELSCSTSNMRHSFIPTNGASVDL